LSLWRNWKQHFRILTLVDTQLVLRDVPLSSTGRYWVELRTDGTLIGQRPFYVNEIRRDCPSESRDVP